MEDAFIRTLEISTMLPIANYSEARSVVATRCRHFADPHWSLALERVAREGSVLMHGVLGRQRLRALRTELSDCQLRPALEHIGIVDQHAEIAVLSGPQLSMLPALRDTAGWLTRHLERSGWSPNEATIMAYSGPGGGITPHRDHRRFVLVIAVLSINGVARFRIVGDRAGCSVLQDWECTPGDLVLLRAPGLVDWPDGSDPRPLHTVLGPSAGRRVSLTFRMDKTAN